MDAKREKLISIWNDVVPQFPLKVADLIKPHSMTGALLCGLMRLRVDVDNALAPPPEDEWDEHTPYYMDLFPVINVNKIMNHLLIILQSTENPYFPLSITHLLQPDNMTSHTVLLFLVNFIAYNENWLAEFGPFEEGFFGKKNEIKSLEEKKDNLTQMLNEQAEVKGKMADRMKKEEQERKQLEEELKNETEKRDEEEQELSVDLEALKQLKIQTEQKKNQEAMTMAEVTKRKALRVYDGDVIEAQVKKLAQNLQEHEEKINLLKATHLQKENSLSNLKEIFPHLECANDLQHEVMKLTDSLKKLKTGDHDTAKATEDELSVLNAEISKIQAQLSELETKKQKFEEKQAEIEFKRQQHQTLLKKELSEKIDNAVKSEKQALKCTQYIDDIKKRIEQYSSEKRTASEELVQIERDFRSELKSFEDALIEKTKEAEEMIRKKFGTIAD